MQLRSSVLIIAGWPQGLSRAASPECLSQFVIFEGLTTSKLRFPWWLQPANRSVSSESKWHAGFPEWPRLRQIEDAKEDLKERPRLILNFQNISRILDLPKHTLFCAFKFVLVIMKSVRLTIFCSSRIMANKGACRHFWNVRSFAQMCAFVRKCALAVRPGFA